MEQAEANRQLLIQSGTQEAAQTLRGLLRYAKGRQQARLRNWAADLQREADRIHRAIRRAEQEQRKETPA